MCVCVQQRMELSDPSYLVHHDFKHRIPTDARTVRGASGINCRVHQKLLQCTASQIGESYQSSCISLETHLDIDLQRGKWP